MTIRDTFFIPAVKMDANPVEGNILPNSVRQFTLQWLKNATPSPVQGFFNTISYQWQNFAVGLYSAHLNLVYGTEGLHVTKTVWFCVLPWQLLLCIIAGLFIIWWIGKKIVIRYNRYIISNAQAGMRQHDSERT